MPRQVLIVTTILCLVAAGLGLWLGLKNAGITESDVIEAAAARWSEETGTNDLSSCVAWAHSEGDVWLEVTCGMGDDQQTYRYDKAGRLLRERPET